MIDTYTTTAPAHWACYFMYGDCSDMADKEIAAADAFAQSLGGEIADCGDEQFFQHWHDAASFFPFGAICLEYTVIVRA